MVESAREPLEVGGEESYTNHPLWSMASLAYYDRALSEDEVAFNHGASDCLELGVVGQETLTWEESKSNLALFAVTSSPLILGVSAACLRNSRDK